MSNRHDYRMSCDICSMRAINEIPISDSLREYHGIRFICPQGHKLCFQKGMKFHINESRWMYQVSEKNIPISIPSRGYDFQKT